MCLADLGPVLSVDTVAGTAEVDLAGRTKVVSLAPLVWDGRSVVAGDWLVVHTGLAVEIMDQTAAAEVVASRNEMLNTGDSRAEDRRQDPWQPPR